MNISKVAELAGVGKATVSRVLNNKKGVSKETADLVLKACAQLNYVPNYFASNIMNAQTKIFGLFLPVNSPKYYAYYNELLEGCIVKAYEYDMQILPYFAADTEKIGISLMRGKSPLMGAILLTPNIEEKRLNKLQSIKIPCVVIGTLSGGSDDYLSIDVDNGKLVTLFLDHLKARGHTEIAFINSIPEITITADRDRAVAAFMKENPEVRVYTEYCEDVENLAVGLFHKMKRSHGAITAAVVSSEILAKDLYDDCEARGLVVGRDLSLISLGGSAYADVLRPRLTRGVQNYRKLGSACIDMLMEKLRGEVAVPHRLLESEVVWGDSVADLRS